MSAATEEMPSAATEEMSAKDETAAFCVRSAEKYSIVSRVDWEMLRSDSGQLGNAAFGIRTASNAAFCVRSAGNAAFCLRPAGKCCILRSVGRECCILLPAGCEMLHSASDRSGALHFTSG